MHEVVGRSGQRAGCGALPPVHRVFCCGSQFVCRVTGPPAARGARGRWRARRRWRWAWWCAGAWRARRRRPPSCARPSAPGSSHGAPARFQPREARSPLTTGATPGHAGVGRQQRSDAQSSSGTVRVRGRVCGPGAWAPGSLRLICCDLTEAGRRHAPTSQGTRCHTRAARGARARARRKAPREAAPAALGAAASDGSIWAPLLTVLASPHIWCAHARGRRAGAAGRSPALAREAATCSRIKREHCRARPSECARAAQVPGGHLEPGVHGHGRHRCALEAARELCLSCSARLVSLPSGIGAGTIGVAARRLRTRCTCVLCGCSTCVLCECSQENT